MTSPPITAGDLPAEALDRLHEQLADPRPEACTRLAVAAVDALPALLAEVERRRAEDETLSLFRKDGDLVAKVAALIAAARLMQAGDCDDCDGSLLRGACPTHIAAVLIAEIREQRLVVLTAEAANEIVRDLRERAGANR